LKPLDREGQIDRVLQDGHRRWRLMCWGAVVPNTAVVPTPSLDKYMSRLEALEDFFVEQLVANNGDTCALIDSGQ